MHRPQRAVHGVRSHPRHGNHIAPGLLLPETLESVLRGDWKFFAALSGIALVLGGLMFATLPALTDGMAGNPEMVEMMTAYSAYGY